jgi:hypothetical protein
MGYKSYQLSIAKTICPSKKAPKGKNRSLAAATVAVSAVVISNSLGQMI